MFAARKLVILALEIASPSTVPGKDINTDIDLIVLDYSSRFLRIDVRNAALHYFADVFS